MMNRHCYLIISLSWIFFFCEHSIVVLGFRVHHHNRILFHRTSHNAIIGASQVPKHFVGESRLGLSAEDNNNNKDDDDEGKIPSLNSIVDKASEYFVLFLGAGVAGSFAINALGYGFAAQPGGGVRFDTIQQLRTERQMERSINRPDGIYTTGSRSQNPAVDFFLKNPLIVTLTITAVSLAVDEIRGRNKDK